jgi:hypothetical protein
MIHEFKVLPFFCITRSNNWGQIPIVLALKNGGNGEMGVRFQLISSLKVTLEPPAMGTHFSGLSLKKWSPGRAALK